jgi:membrane fusion protein, macrolide-specific efflux system
LRKKLLIGGGVLVFAVIVVAILTGNRTRRVEVETAEVDRKPLVATVSASGTIHPKRSVDVSANTIGRVVRLAVAEGDTVAAGDFLLEIDPSEFRSVVRSLEAGLQSAEADLRLAQASQEKAELDLVRARQLHE